MPKSRVRRLSKAKKRSRSISKPRVKSRKPRVKTPWGHPEANIERPSNPREKTKVGSIDTAVLAVFKESKKPALTLATNFVKEPGSLFDSIVKTVEFKELNAPFGHKMPRLQAAFAETKGTYKFGGSSLKPKPKAEAPQALKELWDRINKETGVPFNFALVNHYRSRVDSIAPHYDDEKIIDPSKPVASISLGDPRKFCLCNADKRNTCAVGEPLPSGSLAFMLPPTPCHFVPKVAAEVKAKKARSHYTPPHHHHRVNITFRVNKW
jgi:alkylated DNA repair dioxygenase AlkB